MNFCISLKKCDFFFLKLVDLRIYFMRPFVKTNDIEFYSFRYTVRNLA